KASSYLLALVFFVLSLLSKPMTITMPLVLLILDYYPLDRIKKDGWKKPLLEKLPFLGLSLGIGLITVLSQTGALAPAEALPFEGRLHIAARGYLFYIYKTLVPVNLAPLYPLDFASGLNLLFALYVLTLSAVAVLVFYLRKWSNAYISACAYFVITLLPVIGLLQVGKQAAADRYTYLPGISLAVLISAGAGWVVMKRRKMFLPMLAALAVISGLLASITFRQQTFWKDSISLWTRQVSIFPDYDQGYVNRGNSYLGIGRLDLAMEDLSRITPATAGGFMNRANAYISLGKFDLAIENLDRAIALGPVSADAYLKRGSALVSAGRSEEGVSDLTRVLDADPRNKAAYRARGTAHAIAGRYGDAIRDFLKAVELDPADTSTHIDLGKTYMHLGDRRNSYLSMKKAHELGDPSAYGYLKELEALGAGHGE
ncbi:MAG: tetratricopeptide repeat protein, partial [Candidatus Methylomirabilis sp.]|nr:tetratricopeptide repeat protein [Deltaproteobacteria bacterium]